MEGGIQFIVYNNALLHPQVTSALISECCIVMHLYLRHMLDIPDVRYRKRAIKHTASHCD